MQSPSVQQKLTQAGTFRVMRVVVITGGSRGIGAATSLLAAKNGYSVVVNYKDNKAAASQVVEEITDAGGRAIAVPGDVGVEADVMRLFDSTLAEFGQIDALVNNAGILEPHTTLENMTAARISRVLNTNVLGSLLCAREAVKHMSTDNGGNGGSIVNVSSIAAKLGSPNEYVDYAATKGAVDTLTIGLAKEVAGIGVRVNAVRPGVIYTEIHASGGEPDRVDRVKHTVPMQRGGTAGEVALSILWLLSNDASYTTGAFIDVSGGR